MDMRHFKFYKTALCGILVIGITGGSLNRTTTYASEQNNFEEWDLDEYDDDDDYTYYKSYQYTSVTEFKEIVSPWSFDFLETYTEIKKIPDLDDTIEKAQKILDTCSDLDTCVQVTEKGSWGKSYYAQTKKNTGLYYAGDIKDGKPDGVGMLIEVLDTYDYSIIRKKYAGEFKKGVITGFGLKFNDDELHSDVYSQLNGCENKDDGQWAFDNYFNPVSYVGEIKNGQCTGEGITLLYRDISDFLELLSDGATMEELDSNNIFMSDVTIVKGEHKKGEWNGDIKMYVNGKLLYDGEMKNDQPNGKGKLYYPNSDILKYEGSFKNGEYNGKGTEYSEEGKEIYSGKWKNGDYDS